MSLQDDLQNGSLRATNHFHEMLLPVDRGGFQTKDSGKREEYSTGMRRDTQEGKPRYDLLIADNGFTLLTRWAELMARGAEKYGQRNWEKAETQEEAERFRASAFRHFMQWMRGDKDEDHAAATMFNINAYEYTNDRLKLPQVQPSLKGKSGLLCL